MIFLNDCKNHLEILIKNQLTAWEIAVFREYQAHNYQITLLAKHLRMHERSTYKLIERIIRKLTIQSNMGKRC